MEDIETTTSRGGTLQTLTFTPAGHLFDSFGPSRTALPPPIKTGVAA